MLLGLAACSNSGAKIDGKINNAPESDVIVKLLDVNEYKVLDTLKTDKSGAFSYKVDVKKTDPEFVYLYHGNTKMASLILQAGDKVTVVADTLGLSYTVEGSEESAKLASLEEDFRTFLSQFSATANQVTGEEDAETIKNIQKELSKQYVNYYRSRVKYVLENPFSLSTVPVLYQNINENFPVFSQQTDAIHFRSVHDSLAKVYPDSKFVKSLEREAARREKVLNVNTQLSIAEEVGFIDLVIPDTKGEKVALSSLKSNKVVMVHFWMASDANSANFNQILKSVYGDFHSKGLEIYQVSLDVDKVVWGTTVRSQELPWVNVCDGLGTSSASVALYGVTGVPCSYFIVDGELVQADVTNEASLRRFLAANLK